jgi:hypothetical protein
MQEAERRAKGGAEAATPAAAIDDEVRVGGGMPSFAPQVAGPSASDQAYGMLYDKQPGAVQGQETARSHVREFENMTAESSKFSDAPKAVTLAVEAQRGLQASWDESKAHGHDKERGGNLVREVHNGHMTRFDWRQGKAIKDDQFNPDPDDHEENQRVVATGHTHGYASGAEDVTFSDDDLAGLVDESQNLDLLQSGASRYMVARTKEFEAQIKDLDEEQLTNVRNKIRHTWRSAFKGTGTIQERSERATTATCRAFKLAYYRGTGGTLARIV